MLKKLSKELDDWKVDKDLDNYKFDKEPDPVGKDLFPTTLLTKNQFYDGAL